MIHRIVEYVVRCDGPDCYESCAYGSDTREQCHKDAIDRGWQPCTYRRWLCPHCKALAERKATTQPAPG